MTGHHPDRPAVVVFEKRPRWAPELQRQFVGEDVPVRACSTAREVATRLRASPGCVLLLDLDSDAAECLQLLGRMLGAVPFVPMIVVGSPRTADLEWAVRELGAIEFAAGPISGAELAALCRRQWRPMGAVEVK